MYVKRYRYRQLV